ncbi:MAG: hypothetical protein ACRDIL_18595 [Candidatus Limnocylindrales bacterium]
MTIEASGGKASRFGRRSAATVGLPIGEADANIFNCPACARPLAVRTSRCPGCATRLVAGVRATKAAGFVIVGLLAGLMVGGGSVAVVTAVTRPATITVDAPPIVTPSQAVLPTSRPVPPVDPGIPTAALTALRQSTVVNQRLLADADKLAAALAASPAGKDIAPILRSLAANAGFGDGLAPSIAAWDDGLAVSQGLVTFYAAIGGVAQNGLAASLSNTRAYVDAGKRMMAVIDGMTDLDAASRVLAASADLELPLLVPPVAP